MSSLIIHGGAWDIPDDAVEAHRKGVARALEIGWHILETAGSSVDAVEKAILSMEDDETFDAGRGSHLNAAGQVELDASIMNGRTMSCGAVACVRFVRNPIGLARKVMEESEHILLVGEGAELFAKDRGIRLCTQEDLIIDRERKRWNGVRGRKNFTTKDAFRKSKKPSDTVGAVAIDSFGNIAVGTSTGGTFNKTPGRVGDSPLIGCGSYADNSIGGVSTTGWGEGMIKVVMAKTVVDLLEYNNGDAQKAAEEGIRHLKDKVDGHGGVIVLNSRGEFGISFNTPRMAYAYRNSDMDAPVVRV
ncbi:MAG TPA: isoaspartyl peptidase/L-asparaginase [Bacteroidota bacterium]|nr:isoaspartyl peptidase/L-asparaginase [Bacteroidota bacterium]